jgi:prepilin-type N-terminal cleavage/methylation domain-containing protein
MITKIRDMMKRKNGQKGFTLVELIVVMAILAVLAAIAVPRFGTVLTDSKSKADVANQALLVNSGELWFAAQATTPIVVTVFTSASNAGLVPDYLKVWPTDPSSTKNYSLSISTTGVCTVTKV